MRSPVIQDVPPQRVHDYKDLVNAAMILLLATAVILASVYLQATAQGVEADVHHAGVVVSWLVELPLSLLRQVVTVVIVISVLAQMLLTREWVQSITAACSMMMGYAAAGLVSWLMIHFGSSALVDAMNSGLLAHNPLLPDIFAGLAAFLTAAGPHRLHGTVKWGWNTLITVAVLMVVISVEPIAGVVVAMAIGRLIGLLVRFTIGTQNKGAWGEQVVQALRTVGLNVATFTRREPTNGISGSDRYAPASLADDLAPHSRIYDAITDDGNHYVVSVRDEQNRTVGYLSQLWKWLRMASGIDLRTDRSMSATTHHHIDLLLTLHNMGLPTLDVYARTESGESSILVFGSGTRLRPVDWNVITDDELIEFMRYLDVANKRGVTHRNISPASFACTNDGHMVLAGWQNADDASSAANVSIDRVQMVAALSCRMGLPRTLDCAQRYWGREGLAQLIPFAQNVAIAAATKTDDFWSRGALRTMRQSMRDRCPEDEVEAPEQVTLSRFSIKSVITLALLIMAAFVMFTQLKPQEFLRALEQANPWMAALSFVFGVLSWIGSGVALGAFIDEDRRNYPGILASQAVGTFTTLSMPAGLGPAFVNLQFIRRSGYRNAAATAIMSAVVAVQALTIAGLLVVIGVFTGRNTLSGMIPTNMLVIAIASVAAIASLVMVLPPTRKLVRERLLPIVLAYARQLIDLLSQPGKLLASAAGWLLQNVTLGLSFWAALMAFGRYTNPIETTFMYVLTNTVASAVPTPGGLGAIEAALTLGFSSVGVPSAIAFSATMLFRLLTYWLRIPIGAVAMKWMNARHML